ncbi:MAG TPA: hypothetical protein VJ691_04020 [Vicinamibacterales bacterium]|nr:hypothetical protein [Vicinamibacterales bacterium]
MQSAEDVEYGPTPPGAKYEHTDIDPEVGYKFALWLAVSLVLSVGIVYGTFWYFERQQVAADAAVERFPLAVDGERPEPTPALQKQPFHDITALRQEEAGRLGTYGWVDKEGGVARIPIDRAMEILLQKGLPVRPESVSSSTTVVQDSSSGRTSVPR